MTTAQAKSINFIVISLRAHCLMDPTAEVRSFYTDKSAVVSFHQGGADVEFTIGAGGGFYDVNGRVDKWDAVKRVRNKIDPAWA